MLKKHLSRFTLRIPDVILFTVLVLALLTGLNTLYGVSDTELVLESPNPNNVRFIASISNINITSYEIKVHFRINPIGTFATYDRGNTSKFSNTPILTTAAKIDRTVFNYAGGVSVGTQDATVPIASGIYAAYPFDAYATDFIISAKTTHPDTNQNTSVPISLYLTSRVNGWIIDTQFTSTGNSTQIQVNVKFTRVLITKVFSVAIFIVMWIISVTLLFIAVGFWAHEDRPAAPMVGLYTALL